MVEGQVIPTISHHHQPLKAEAELLYQLNSPVASEKCVWKVPNPVPYHKEYDAKIMTNY